MSGGKIGRGFADLPIEEQVQALRDHALGQELLIKVLLTAVERLGVTFNWGDDTPEVSEQELPNPDPPARTCDARRGAPSSQRSREWNHAGAT